MSLLYLIRHGQASFRSAEYDRLSELGARQSALLGDHLARLGIRFAAVFSGSKKRQIDTAAILMRRLGLEGGPQVLPEFDEHATFDIITRQMPAMVAEDPGIEADLERLYDDAAAFKRVFRHAILRWMSGTHAIEGVERYADFLARVRRGLAEATAGRGREERVAVISSGGPIAAALLFALGVSDETSLELDLQVHNTSVSVFKAGGRRLVLTSFNSAAHFERNGDLDLLTHL